MTLLQTNGARVVQHKPHFKYRDFVSYHVCNTAYRNRPAGCIWGIDEGDRGLVASITGNFVVVPVETRRERCALSIFRGSSSS